MGQADLAGAVLMRLAPLLIPALLAACAKGTVPAAAEPPFAIQPVATFDEPWAMAFLPDGRMLVTEKKGSLRVVTAQGQKSPPVAGTPRVDYGGQGGFGDVALSPDFRNDGLVYLSWAEAGEGDTRGAAVGRAKLVIGPGAQGGRLEGLQVIWRQEPKTTGRGHYSHRLAFSPDGRFLFIAAGDRQKITPAQDPDQLLGKIVRLTPTGGIPSDNPNYDQGRIRAQWWSTGHRNILGMAFDAQGRLWEVEHGPAGGDELNLVKRGANYGWPVVSNGDHYDGRPIPRHRTRPEFEAPKVTWNPVIAPGDMAFVTGPMFRAWNGNLLVAGLGSQALVRVTFAGESAREAERFEFENRLRDVTMGPDGAIWLLEDGEGGRLLRLTPKAGAPRQAATRQAAAR
jgi:glucose/arabinose dehydrogenase